MALPSRMVLVRQPETGDFSAGPFNYPLFGDDPFSVSSLLENLSSSKINALQING